MGDKDLARALTQMVDANRKRDEQMEEDQRRRDLRMEELAEATRIRDEQLAKILQAMVPAAAGAAVPSPTIVSGSLPSYPQFDPAVEIWTEYWARFKTFMVAQSVPEEKKAHVFLTNQSTLIYRMLTNLAAQQATPKETNDLTIDEITEFMKEQYDPKKFVIRERYHFWRKMDRKPGETIPELAARLRADAATCDFASIKDPQDEALRTRFFCSVGNEGVLKAFFRYKDEELTFTKAVEIAQEMEDVSAVAKETVYGKDKSPVCQIDSEEEPTSVDKVGRRRTSPPRKQPCDRCGRTGHTRDSCRMKNATCFHCQEKGHTAAMCRGRQRGSPPTPRQPINETHDVRLLRTVKRVGQVRRIDKDGDGSGSMEPTSPGGGGASQEGRPNGAVSDWKQNRQPRHFRPKGERSSPHAAKRNHPANGQPQGERSPPLKGDRPANGQPQGERRTTRRGDRLANGQPYGATTTRTVYGETPTMESEDERRESISKEESVGSGSSTSANERELSRKEAKRRRRSRYRQRRRAKKEVPKLQSSDPRHWIKERHLRPQPIPLRDDSPIGQAAVSGVRSRSTSIGSRRGRTMPPQVTFQPRRGARQTESRSHQRTDRTERDDRDFGGEESSDATKKKTKISRPPTAAADDVDPRRRGERAAAGERMEFVGSVIVAVKETVGAVIAAVIGFVWFMIAAYHRRYDREAEMTDVGKQSVSKDDGDNSQPTQMTERQQSDRGTDDGDSDYKGKFAFTSVHHAVRQPPDRVSSVSTFRIAHRDEDEPQPPSEVVADEDPGRMTTCDASASPQTEEVSSPSHVSPPGYDDEGMKRWHELTSEKGRHRDDRRNWFNWDTVEEAILVGPARQQRRRELEEAEPPDISILFG